MKKIVKILPVLLMLTMLLAFSMTVVVNATVDPGQVDGLFGQEGDTTGITNVGATIVNIVTTIGIIVAVIVLLVLGIKYMMGSASEKAEYKKTMIPYLVGAVLVFGASAIAKAVIQMSGSLTSGL